MLQAASLLIPSLLKVRPFVVTGIMSIHKNSSDLLSHNKIEDICSNNNNLQNHVKVDSKDCSNINCNGVDLKRNNTITASPSLDFPVLLSDVSIPTTIHYVAEKLNSTNNNYTLPPTLPISETHNDKTINLTLSTQERELFDLLLQAADAFARGEIALKSEAKDGDSNNHDHKSPNVPLTLRIAGGWVRDTIWNVPTHDIDVAVDNVTGVEMATIVQEYCNNMTKSENGNELDGDSNNPKSCGRIGVIAANPAQSKHLETATMRTCGVEVDYCNLRAQEIYQEDSRIPLTRFGSPLEDAERRDFTINALFYNLHTQKVEDWTRRGLPDLLAHRLSTPLEPVQTFRDDPLRVLRAIRFAVRYHLNLDPALSNACQLLEIHHALHVKVSRERVGKELESMLSGKGARPVAALNLISELKLAGSVFSLPLIGLDNVIFLHGPIAGHEYGPASRNANDPEARHLRQMGWNEAHQLLQYCTPVVQAHQEHVQNRNIMIESKLDTRLLPVAIYLLPFRHLQYTERKNVDRVYSAVSYVFRQGIKFKNKDVHAMSLLQENVDQMVQLLRKVASEYSLHENGEKLPLSRLDAGLLVRTSKELWITLLLLATVLLVHEQDQTMSDVGDKAFDWISFSVLVFQTIAIDLNLDECWKVKPLMDGKGLMEALDLPRGPSVSMYLDEQMRWMLMNPNGTKEECQRHLLLVKQQQEIEQQQKEDLVLGISDGKVNQPSSSLQTSRGKSSEQHFSKKMHVESMDVQE